MIKYIFSLVFLAAVAGASWLTPWSRLPASVTVIGEAKQQAANQTATYNVSVTEVNADKQAAVNAVNETMTAITAAVKEFGIDEADLTTANVSVYETNRPKTLIYPPQPQNEEKQWQANNRLEIILRQTDRASELTDLLQGFERSQVSGPRFSLEDSSAYENDLTAEAMADARAKAAQLAEAGGRKLGKVLQVNESGTSQPFPYYRAGLAAAEDAAVSSAPVEPGSTQISKTITVVFELK